MKQSTQPIALVALSKDKFDHNGLGECFVFQRWLTPGETRPVLEHLNDVCVLVRPRGWSVVEIENPHLEPKKSFKEANSGFELTRSSGDTPTAIFYELNVRSDEVVFLLNPSTVYC